jgi:hypothetical protein
MFKNTPLRLAACPDVTRERAYNQAVMPTSAKIRETACEFSFLIPSALRISDAEAGLITSI